jgi:ABC-type multidrug transport system fused ATPase/permease subunit
MVFSTIFGGFRGGLLSYASYLVNYSMRKDLFRSIVKQEIAFFDKAQTGLFSQKLSQDGFFFITLSFTTFIT